MAAIFAIVLFCSIPPALCGAAAYRLLDDFADDLDPGNMIEIGSDRGEGSTRWLAEFAARQGKKFYTVDFSSEGYLNGQRACGSCAFQGMGEAFLKGQFDVLNFLHLIYSHASVFCFQIHIHRFLKGWVSPLHVRIVPADPCISISRFMALLSG
jgi:hypothetical protein